MIIVTGDSDIRIALCLGGGENWVQDRDSAPVREEVTLLIVGRWRLAEVETVINSLREFELITRRSGRQF